jgi:hypothetical protein
MYLESAKKHLEKALSIYSKIKDSNNMLVTNDKLNEILVALRVNSENVLIFAKAYPLV